MIRVHLWFTYSDDPTKEFPLAMMLSELAAAIEAEVVGDGAVVVSAVNTLEAARAGEVSFLSNPKYEKKLATTAASAVIVGPNVASGRLNLLRTRDPYFAFSRALALLNGVRKHPHEGIHPRAYVDPTATVGEGTVIYPNAYVGPRAKIGRDCVLFPCSVVYDDCVVGDRCVLHACVVVGNDGFGFATHKGVHHKIPQVGICILEDDVELGANTAIQRATMGATVIGKGTKMGDGVMIGHATTMGPHCLIVSQVGLAGSTTVGHHVTMAGQVGAVGHITIGDKAIISAKAGIINDVPAGAIMMGLPATPVPHGRRQAMLMGQLPELADRIRALEKQVTQLTAVLGGQGTPPAAEAE